MEKRRCCGCMNLTDEPVCPICGTDRSYTNQFHQLPVGTMLRDQYLVGKVLGQGGFGITYIGWDTYLDIPVAIKEFYPGNTVNRDCAQSCSVRIHAPDLEAPFEASKERFLREAKALAKLRHVPQIVGIQSFFKENGTAYIVMEFIKGTDLRHYVSMRGGKLGVGETFRILEPIFHALSTVHQAGLVHRDISPDNIMLDPMGGAKLLDFGAARDVESADADVDLARSTEAILKQGFAPMEQYRSRGGLGPWTDEYGLCATIYYCLTGKVPPDAIARSMDEAQLDWDSIPDLEPHQKAALEQGMAMRAKDRFGSMEELRRAIYTNREAPSDAAQPKPAPAKPAPVKKEPVPAPKSFSTGKKRGKFVVLGIVAVLVLVAAIALPGMFSREQPELPEEPVIATQESAPEQTTQPDIPEQETTEPVTEPVTEPAPPALGGKCADVHAL